MAKPQAGGTNKRREGSVGGSSGGGGGGGKAVNAKMPQLTGSAKQVAWAESIRHDALEAIDSQDRHIDRMVQQVKGFKTPPKNGVLAEAESLAGFTRSDVQFVKKDLISALQSVTSASQIIDNRRELSPDAISRRVRKVAQMRR